MLDKKLIDKEFAHLRDVIFLNAASVVIPPKSVQAAYHGFMDEYVDRFGEGVVDRAWEIVEEARHEVAHLIGARPTEIGFVKNTSEGIGIIANGYPFTQGDNVVTVDQEHSSNLFAWIKLQEKGVKLRVVESRNGEIRLKDIFSRVTARTRAISLSAVQFTTGFYTDLATLGSFCERHGILLIVDGIQAVGRLLFTEYVYPFELASVILLVGIVAAVSLTLRGKRANSKAVSPSEQVFVKAQDCVRLLKMPAEKQD